MKYQESALPEGTHIRVNYVSKLRTCELSMDLPLWYTIARLLDKDNNLLATGESECSDKDTPNKKIGRAIAVGRALKSYAEA